MSNTVIIFAEKPSQARSYAQAYKVKNKSKTHIELEASNTFPNGAIITWGVGHLVGLKMPGEYKEEWRKWNLSNLPIIPDKFEYKVSSNVKDQFKAVKKLFDDAETIINACDVDREGSNIFYSTLFMTGYQNSKKPLKRLWINSLEEDEVRKGFANLQDNQKDLLMYEEAKARQQADWLVGMNASQLYTLLMQQNGYPGSLSIGRVQSPTVYLIYQRQKEIENFVSKPFYEIEATFTSENGMYKGKANIKEDSKDTVQAVLDKHDIQGNEKGVIASVETKEKREKSPKLHSLSTLQSKANKRWKYSPKKVLDIVQKLYDNKILSYPRTDSNYITENEFTYLVNNINAYQSLLNVSFEADTQPNKRYVNNKKVEEHYAIIPTKKIPSSGTLQGLSEEEKNIYYEVIATTLGMFHEDYIYDEKTVITDVNELSFKSTGKTEKNKGWKSLFPPKSKEGAENDQEDALPNVSNGESVQGDIRIKEGKTKPPKPYTEGQLINMMKTCGKLVDDETDSDVLKEVEGLGTEATRSGIIERIKQQQYIEIKKNVATVTEKGKIMCESIEGTLLASPSMTAKWETYLNKIGNNEGSKDIFIDKITQFINKIIQEVPDQINSSNVMQQIESEKENRGIASCPSCSGQIENKGKFFGCSGYKHGCKVTFPKKWAGKNLTNTMVKSLCEKGATNKLKGFQGKNGKFEAVLTLNNESEIKFDFSK